MIQHGTLDTGNVKMSLKMKMEGSSDLQIEMFCLKHHEEVMKRYIEVICYTKRIILNLAWSFCTSGPIMS